MKRLTLLFYYISGEKLFFRAFLLNAFSHASSGISRYEYVEGVTLEGTLIYYAGKAEIAVE